MVCWTGASVAGVTLARPPPPPTAPSLRQVVDASSAAASRALNKTRPPAHDVRQAHAHASPTLCLDVLLGASIRARSVVR